MEPERYLEPLRQEVLDNLEDNEITPAMLGKLHKMDSFLRESGRFNNAGLCMSPAKSWASIQELGNMLTSILSSGNAEERETRISLLRRNCAASRQQGRCLESYSAPRPRSV